MTAEGACLMVASVDDDLWWFVLIFYADGEDLFGSIMGKATTLWWWWRFRFCCQHQWPKMKKRRSPWWGWFQDDVDLMLPVVALHASNSGCHKWQWWRCLWPPRLCRWMENIWGCSMRKWRREIGRGKGVWTSTRAWKQC